jgi:hypothetical protein
MTRRLWYMPALALLAAAAVAGAAGAGTTSFSFPINFPVSACGTTIQLTGSLHSVSTVTENSGGGLLLSFTTNPQGVTGVDANGVSYQGTGVTTFTATFNRAATLTFVNNFRLISNGTTADFIVMDVVHLTVNANGVVTVLFDQPTMTCRSPS